MQKKCRSPCCMHKLTISGMADESPQGLQYRFQISKGWERFRAFSPIVNRATSFSTAPSSLLGDMAEKAKPAKVSLARVTIDAPPSKVYEKLADVQSWNDWHKSAWVLRAPGLEKLKPGERFSYTAPFVLGNVSSEVIEVSPNQTLEWSDKALFGLVNGGHRWRLQGKGKRLLGLIGKQQTQVVLDQEVTGFGQLLVSGEALEKHAATWLTELKQSVEGTK